jgi:hypothetical protein
MRQVLNQFSPILSVIFLMSCASALPPARIGDYVSSHHSQVGGDEFAWVNQRPLQAGLVVVPERELHADLNLPEEALVRLSESLQRDLGRAIPVTITDIIPADGIRPQPYGDWVQFDELGQRYGLDYLVVVVVSSTEQEYPMTLPLGLTTHAQPGFRRDHWSLLECALLDLKHSQILMQAEGRGWATLDRPNAPGINQWYPANLFASTG